MSNIKVLVTRPKHQAESLCALLNLNNLLPISMPTLKIVSVEPQALDLSEITMMIWTSPNAVRCMPAAWVGEIHKHPNLTLIPMGEGTQKALAELGLRVDYIPPPGTNSELLFQTLSERGALNQNIAIVTGFSGRGVLALSLSKAGASITEYFVYRRETPNDVPFEALLADWIDADRSVAIFTSSQSFDNLLQEISNPSRVNLLTNPIVVASERIRDHLETKEAKQLWLASSALESDLVDCITRNL